jgi:TetR/AcrR family acrAB operon transcriptional repressor
MVRRTKADAEVTRQRLLDAAETLFQSKGVSSTSLHDIAVTAGATRGAIYWHFKDKADLFNAMMDRVTLPLDQMLASVNVKPESQKAPLRDMRRMTQAALTLVSTDERTRRVFEIATHQVEYNAEMSAVRDRHLHTRSGCMAQTTEALAATAALVGLKLPIPVETASLGLYALIDGLIQNWLLDTRAFDIVAAGLQVHDAYLIGLGFRPEDLQEPAPESCAAAPGGTGASAGLPRAPRKRAPHPTQA